ncbi:hypothetical protein M9458_055370 [Cirrhinus mrigala]|uniref:ribonuclease H n=1 Tax=Cirrhinus mrigala TaxID=683832 RepID=A0ABD0MJV5_CIRMR
MADGEWSPGCSAIVSVREQSEVRVTSGEDFVKHRSSSGLQTINRSLSSTSVLAAHQQQLACLTTLTEKMVKTLQSLRLPSSETTSPPLVSAPQTPLPNPPIASPHLAYPEKFDDMPAKGKGFLLQCSLFVTQQPALYPTEESRIAYVCSLLTGKALDWATAVWNLSRPAFPSFETFLQCFKAVFDYPERGEGAGEQILSLHQGKSSAAEYALAFRMLAAQTGWPDDPKLHFRKGLSHELQAELAYRDEGKTLDELIDLAVHIDNLICSRRPNRSSTFRLPNPPSIPEQEAMQVGHTRLTPEERNRCFQLNLCLYCSESGHMKASCPSRPIQRTSSAVSQSLNTSKSVAISVSITFSEEQIFTTALIDSGAAGNFIDVNFAESHGLPLIPCKSPLTVAALDGRPLGGSRVQHTTCDIHLTTGALHTESIRFFIIQAPNNPVILGLPWLQLHEPQISWTEGQITQWSDKCLTQSLQTPKPKLLEAATVKLDSPNAVKISPEYYNLAEAFSKTKATQLPPHRPSDCATELLPGTTPPKGRIFPLSQPETDSMKAYIEEELAKGFIAPSTSPASAGFFFVKKKDGSLRPCIDFRGLNEITVKYRYPLPLVPPALEQLCSAKYFTKLDLRNAYNLIRIREGDEWKTAFSTTSGHYEYRVMPFGLVNSPSVFQAFINDVFRDMLGRWVIIYMDDILIYSNSLETHITHVRAVLLRLISHQLYAKAEKCEFHQTSTTFLGYVVSPERVAMNDRKVQAVLNWPRPTNIKELQRFLGFANFYRFWWPSLRSDTIAFVKNCVICNISKSSKQLPAGLLQPLPIPQRPWSHIAIDFVTDLPLSNGYTTILTVIDRFSKSCRLIPLPKLPTALETVEALCEFVFRFYGLPDDIVSDRGSQFTSRVWTAFFKCLNVSISLTSGYHPESNGQTERLNQEITRFLRSYCHHNQSDWSKFLFWAEYAQNSLHKPSTGLTPFQCVLEFQPLLFPWSGEPSDLPAVNDWLRSSEATWNAAHTHLQHAIRRQKELADRHRRPNSEFIPGSWVWLSTRGLRL